MAHKTYFVEVKSQFEALHRWKDAPEEVKFLRDFHRHVFVVRVTVNAKHANREVEFFILKKELDAIIKEIFCISTALWASEATLKEMEMSCEQIADIIQQKLEANRFRVSKISVHEDDENGAVVEYA